MNPSSASTPSPAPWRYSATAIVLHWILALLLVFIAAVGWSMMAIEDEPGSARYFDLHKSVGLVIALLVAVRLAWRATHRPQPLPAGMPRWQVRTARATQSLLYLLMVLVPLTGYLGASYSKAGVPFFGLATPRWAVPDHDTAETLFDIHSALVWVLVAGVGVHALAALKHGVLDRDGVVRRMWFPSRR